MPKSADKRIYVIAGSNGAGKTTFAREFLPTYVQCPQFINPDLIAAGLSPFNPAAAAPTAAKLVLSEIRRAIRAGESFAFESTLSGRTYRSLLRDARANGYSLHLFYLWLPSPRLALARIRDRVDAGGHDVPAADVWRRYPRSIRNFFTWYAPTVDTVHFFDNSGEKPRLVFHSAGRKTSILDKSLYAAILKGIQP